MPRSIRELSETYKRDPGSLTPGELMQLRRTTRALKEDRTRAEGQTPRRELTKEDLAGVLAVHVRTVTRYAAEGMPHDAGGHGKAHLYNLAECVKWVSEQGRALGKEPPADPNRAEVDLKLRREKARLAELDRLEREHALHDTEECRHRHLRQLYALKREFLALPRSMAPEVEGRDRTETESILKERITAVLARFAGDYTDQTQINTDGRGSRSRSKR